MTLLARFLLALAAFAFAGAVQARSAEDLLLTDTEAVHDGWQDAQVLFDPDGTLTLADVLARPRNFEPAGAHESNLGKRRGAAWIRLRVAVPAGAAGRWVLDVDYASLDRIDLHVFDGVREERHAVMGDQLDMADRPMASRSHAIALDIPAGQSRLLLLRVQTTGSMIVPLDLHTPDHYQAAEAREQALQGLLAGTGLALLLYSLAQWIALRDAVFGLYAVTLLGTTAFFGALSGIGPQHVWGASTWLTRNGAPFFILVGVCGAFFFVLRALEVKRFSPRVALVVTVCGTIAGATALLQVLGVIGYTTAQAIGMGLGPAPLLLVLPTAFERLRGGDRAAAYVLAGWGFYSIGVLVLVGLLAGALPVGFWSLHAFQFASLVEMSMWMLVLGERVQQIRRSAAAVQAEHDTLRALAHTDVLTGLLNRRGLQEALPPMLARATPRGVLAVFLLDLDGFKAVNDRLGHDAGDELLVGVAKRLRAQLRASDLVARLGGDEFVLAVGGLAGEADAETVGQKLLTAFREPFVAAGEPCRVGLTVGYALAPQDDTTLAGLMKRADAAMYGGKQAGKNCVRRGQASVGLAGA